MKIGFVPEILFDIMVEMPDMSEYVNGRDDLDEIGKKDTPSGYLSLNQSLTERKVRAIKEALFVNKIPIIATSYDYFGEPHCIVLYGWDDTLRMKNINASDTIFKFRTSWGKDYKDDGNWIIPISYISETYQILYDAPKLKFKDVNEDDWFYNDVKKSVFSGLVQGINNTEFKPNDFLIRGDMAIILHRTIEKLSQNLNAFLNTQLQKDIQVKPINFQSGEGFKENFTDISDDQYFYNEICSVCANGYMQGNDDNTFEPMRFITRAEFIAAIIRAYADCIQKIETSTNIDIPKPNACTTVFGDINNERDWYAEYVNTASMLGIIYGDETGNFCPNNEITRAEAVAILNRFFRCIDKSLEYILEKF